MGRRKTRCGRGVCIYRVGRIKVGMWVILLYLLFPSGQVEFELHALVHSFEESFKILLILSEEFLEHSTTAYWKVCRNTNSHFISLFTQDFSRPNCKPQLAASVA